MEKKRIKVLVINAIVAALYVVITTVFAFMSFGNIQFRIAEMLNHLFAFDKKYSYGIIGGVVLANTVFMSASGLGLYDLIFGLGHSICSLVIAHLIFKTVTQPGKRMQVLTVVFTVMIFLVAIELKLALGLPFWLSYAQTAFGEVVVMALGIPIMLSLDKAIGFSKQMN